MLFHIFFFLFNVIKDFEYGTLLPDINYYVYLVNCTRYKLFMSFTVEREREHKNILFKFYKVRHISQIILCHVTLYVDVSVQICTQNRLRQTIMLTEKVLLCMTKYPNQILPLVTTNGKYLLICWKIGTVLFEIDR